MFEWKGRKFDFKVPDPFTGCAIYDGLVSYTVPFGAGFLFGLVSKQPMSSDKLREFQTLCLQNAYEILGTDDRPTHAPVVDGEGHFGIIGATAPLLTALTVRFLDFFTRWWQEESPSASDPAAPGTIPQNP